MPCRKVLGIRAHLAIFQLYPEEGSNRLLKDPLISTLELELPSSMMLHLTIKDAVLIRVNF